MPIFRISALFFLLVFVGVLAGCAADEPQASDIVEQDQDSAADAESDDTPMVDSPTNSDPEQTESNETDPNETDPSKTDPNETDPDKTDPNETDPDKTDPDKTNPDETDPKVESTMTPLTAETLSMCISDIRAEQEVLQSNEASSMSLLGDVPNPCDQYKDIEISPLPIFRSGDNFKADYENQGDFVGAGCASVPWSNFFSAPSDPHEAVFAFELDAGEAITARELRTSWSPTQDEEYGINAAIHILGGCENAQQPCLASSVGDGGLGEYIDQTYFVAPNSGRYFAVFEASGSSRPYDFEIRKVLCGDGHVDPTEQCDDGNLIDGDGCSARCVQEEDFFCWSINGVTSACNPQKILAAGETCSTFSFLEKCDRENGETCNFDPQTRRSSCGNQWTATCAQAPTLAQGENRVLTDRLEDIQVWKYSVQQADVELRVGLRGPNNEELDFTYYWLRETCDQFSTTFNKNALFDDIRVPHLRAGQTISIFVDRPESATEAYIIDIEEVPLSGPCDDCVEGFCARGLRCESEVCKDPGWRSCEAAVPLTAEQSIEFATATSTGLDTVDLRACAGVYHFQPTPGPEQVYSVNIAPESTLVAAAEGTDSVLYLMDDCVAKNILSCAVSAEGPSTEKQIWWFNDSPEPRDLLLVVDSIDPEIETANIELHWSITGPATRFYEP